MIKKIIRITIIIILIAGFLAAVTWDIIDQIKWYQEYQSIYKLIAGKCPP